MKYAIIDGSAVSSMAEIHRTLAEQLSLPEWYGNNLDALHDQLTAIGEPTLLQLLHWEDAESSLGRYAQGALRAIEDAVEENPYLNVIFL